MPPNPYTPLSCPRCGASLPSFDEQIICAYCGTPLVRAAAPAAPESGGEAAGAGMAAGLRMKAAACADPGTGMEAFRLLMPAEWLAQGGVQWNQTNPGSPAHIHFCVYDPRTGHTFTFLPHLSFFHSSDPTMALTFPAGSLYFGSEVRPPVDAPTALRNIVVPRFRGVPGVEILRLERLPDLPAKLRALNPNAPTGMQADGAKVTIRYPDGERVVDEEIIGVTEYSKQAAPTLFGAIVNTFWTVDYLIAQRAPRGQVEASRPLFQVILNSFRLNPQWYARVMQMSQYLVQNQIQHIRDIGELSRSIARANQQISDTIVQGYNQRQAALDQINKQFSQSIRGVESYQDPYSGREVELPGGYRYAWANPLGEYIVSDSAGFNPNVGSNREWTLMG